MVAHDVSTSMRTGDLPPPTLPPCRVCGDRATGFHYGANTCEACKGFFRRSMVKGKRYKCNTDGSCNLQRGEKAPCAFCRFKQCLDVGMSKDGIRRGRYTLERKTDFILEIKHLQRKEKLQRAEKGRADMEKRRSELDALIAAITEYHDEFCSYTKDIVAKIPEKQKEFMESRYIQEAIFGPMRPLGPDEYQELYEMTGLDVDGRRQMFEQQLPQMEAGIKRFVSFAKSLPGFRDLSVPDQISLVKASQFEWWILSAHKGIDCDLGVYTNHYGVTLDRNDVCQLMDSTFSEELFRVSKILGNINLDWTEMALLKAIAVFYTDRSSPLDDFERVTQLQDQMINLMMYYIKREKPNDTCRFARMAMALTELRTAGVYHMKFREEFFYRNQNMGLTLPPLVVEIFGGCMEGGMDMPSCPLTPTSPGEINSPLTMSPTNDIPEHQLIISPTSPIILTPDSPLSMSPENTLTLTPMTAITSLSDDFLCDRLHDTCMEASAISAPDC